MSQSRSVGLRDPTRSVNSIYGMKYQIRNKIKFCVAQKFENYFLDAGNSTRRSEVFNVLFNIFYIDQCVFNLLNATYS